MADEAHREAADWLILLREEPEDAAAQARFEAWLDADPRHARAWVAVSETFDAIGETAPVLEDKWRGAKSIGPLTLRRSMGSTSRIPARNRRRAIAVAVAAAVAIAWLTPSALLHLRSDHMTGAGEIRTVQLADGSVVRLGPQSALAVDDMPGERAVRLLAGQAWFDVRHDPARPFRVAAGAVKTTVLGTHFDVRRVGETVSVSVGEGRVRVVDHGIAPAGARELTAGEWVRVDAEHAMTAGTGNPVLQGAWRDGTIVVRNQSIGEVIDELRPWYGGTILLLSSDLAAARIDGVYDARDPQRALAAIVRQAGGRVQAITPWLLVVR